VQGGSETVADDSEDDEAMVPKIVVDGAVADEAVADEAVADEAVADEAVADEIVPNTTVELNPEEHSVGAACRLIYENLSSLPLLINRGALAYVLW
jgi:hypothetical protein